MIFYLSCTGNTKWAAETLGREIDERLIFIANVGQRQEAYELAEGERLGFCYPVHGWRPPKLVREFIKTLRVKNVSGHYVWALCTAGDTCGEAMDIFCNDLLQEGIVIDSTFSLLMPESYVGLPFMDVDKKENETRKIAEAKKTLTDYVHLISERKKDEHHIVRGRWPKVNSRMIGGFFVRRLLTDHPFRVESTRCVHCGRCVSVCPTGNMRMTTDQEPEWLHTGNCLTCFACYHHCPTHAIEYGNRTGNKGQYFYREIEGDRRR